eukprot:scaffold52597_cov60-Phaeocystis_antarctica.AAC.2
MRDDVLGLDAVLEEEGLSHGLEGHVVGHAEVVHAVDGDGTVVRVVDRYRAHVGVAHGADGVEVDRVAPQPEALSHVATLDVLEAASEALVAA